jgi:short-subunit dehydrogenase
MDYFKDKVILVTGASSGIGEELALALAKRGAFVGLMARRGDRLSELAKRIETVGGIARVFSVDVTDADKIRIAADELRQEYGRIDILIANAGIAGNNEKTRNLDPEAVKNVVDINLLGAVNSVSAVLPEMKERGAGHLVAISSLAGIRGLPKSAAYSASKAGMTALFESIRLDQLGSGVDVSIIQPGFIKTPLTSGRHAKMPFLMELEDSIPLFLSAIEKKKKFAAFPWQLAWVVKAAKILPAGIYDWIAAKARFRE